MLARDAVKRLHHFPCTASHQRTPVPEVRHPHIVYVTSGAQLQPARVIVDEFEHPDSVEHVQGVECEAG